MSQKSVAEKIIEKRLTSTQKSRPYSSLKAIPDHSYLHSYAPPEKTNTANFLQAPSAHALDRNTVKNSQKRSQSMSKLQSSQLIDVAPNRNSNSVGGYSYKISGSEARSIRTEQSSPLDGVNFAVPGQADIRRPHVVQDVPHDSACSCGTCRENRMLHGNAEATTEYVNKTFGDKSFEKNIVRETNNTYLSPSSKKKSYFDSFMNIFKRNNNKVKKINKKKKKDHKKKSERKNKTGSSSTTSSKKHSWSHFSTSTNGKERKNVRSVSLPSSVERLNGNAIDDNRFSEYTTESINKNKSPGNAFGEKAYIKSQNFYTDSSDYKEDNTALSQPNKLSDLTLNVGETRHSYPGQALPQRSILTEYNKLEEGDFVLYGSSQRYGYDRDKNTYRKILSGSKERYEQSFKGSEPEPKASVSSTAAVAKEVKYSERGNNHYNKVKLPQAESSSKSKPQDKTSASQSASSNERKHADVEQSMNAKSHHRQSSSYSLRAPSISNKKHVAFASSSDYLRDAIEVNGDNIKTKDFLNDPEQPNKFQQVTDANSNNTGKTNKQSPASILRPNNRVTQKTFRPTTAAEKRHPTSKTDRNIGKSNNEGRLSEDKLEAVVEKVLKKYQEEQKRKESKREKEQLDKRRERPKSVPSSRSRAAVLPFPPTDINKDCPNCQKLTGKLDTLTAARHNVELHEFLNWLTSGSKEDFGKASELLFTNDE